MYISHMLSSLVIAVAVSIKIDKHLAYVHTYIRSGNNWGDPAATRGVPQWKAKHLFAQGVENF